MTPMKMTSHILLAEDDADDRELFVEAFATINPSATIAVVENGEQLMDHLNRADHIPDCIFLDLNMPRKNGKECLMEIKGNERTENIPIIIYSTSLNTKDIDETFEGGASCFIRKPNRFKDLQALLNKCMASAVYSPLLRRRRGNFVLK
jgi:CheY-like chemotaxis protein